MARKKKKETTKKEMGIGKKKISEEEEISPLIEIKELRKTDPVKAKIMLKKLKRKRAKKNKKENQRKASFAYHSGLHHKETEEKDSQEEVEYVEEEADQELMNHFTDVYKRFMVGSDVKEEKQNELGEDENRINLNDISSSDDDGELLQKKSKNNVSKRLLKIMRKPSILKLKEFSERPELVDYWDTTAHDPYLHVWLKSIKNSVQVPRHWNHKRRYMYGRRGFVKKPYTLPHYIQDTKIGEIRQAMREKEEQKSLKQKMRDRVRPKLHTMDIDYQTLHNAFFRYATKPKMVKFGDLYYEGKELVLKTTMFKPGVISKRLREALDIHKNDPLPWLANMQRYGIPPSYPFLKIKGVNYFPQEKAASGKNSKEERGKTEEGQPFEEENKIEDDKFVYADTVFNVDDQFKEDFLWGELEEVYESDEEEGEGEEEPDDGERAEEKEDEEEKKKEVKEDRPEITDEQYVSGMQSVLTNTKMSGTFTPFMESGINSMVDITSLIPGYETPKYPTVQGYGKTTNVKPYTVIQSESIPISNSTIFGSSTQYKIGHGRTRNTNQFVPGPQNMQPINRMNITPEGIMTPCTQTGTVHLGSESIGVSSVVGEKNTSDINEVRKELNKFEEMSQKVNLAAAQVHQVKKVKKEDKKKKKKEFKF